MDGPSGASTCDQAAVAMLVKEKQQNVRDGRNAAALIESAVVKQMPPDATFSAYA